MNCGVCEDSVAIRRDKFRCVDMVKEVVHTLYEDILMHFYTYFQTI